ncbi:MAG: hypothetical protein DMF77_03765 [Acidobacteria bacterium]|nr:MAG: hypothetical protein DMF77_03765 [Acidobacteriota bacterium]
MEVAREPSGGVRITLDAREVPLLRYALERASLIDTPANQQAAIANFCARVLESLSVPRP